MKLTTLFIFLKAVMAVQNIHFGWEAKKNPATQIRDVTFPMSMPKARHEWEYFFEQAIAFENVPKWVEDHVIYTGLQPMQDQNGKSMVHAVFSSFFAGTRTWDSHCSYGADGGPGVSCAINVESSYEDIFHLKIELVGESFYKGTLINHSSGKRWHIGSFTLPRGVRGMKGGAALGFMEYIWTGLSDGSRTPDTAAIFGTPFTSTPGVGMTLAMPYADPICKTMPWNVKKLAQGALEITIGKQASSKKWTADQWRWYGLAPKHHWRNWKLRSRSTNSTGSAEQAGGDESVQ